MRVLLSACGRKVYLIREVREALTRISPAEPHQVLVCESDPYSPSLQAADAGFLVPRMDAPDFLAAVEALCAEQAVDLLIPSKDTELLRYAERGGRLSRTAVLVQSAPVVTLCTDKYAFHLRLRENFPMPETALWKGATPWSRFPCVLKERGLGLETSGFELCASREELDHKAARMREPLIQEYVRGLEYTVDCLFPAGDPAVAVPRQRLRVRGSVSDVGRVVRHPAMESLCVRFARAIGLGGVANIQFFEREDGELLLLECNPRISGGLQITLAACPLFVEALLRMALERPGLPELPIENDVLVMKYDEVLRAGADRLSPCPTT